MSGINKIKNEVETEKKEQNAGMELWLKDGDEALVAIVPDGSDDKDYRLDKFYTHANQFTRDDGSKGWKNQLCLDKSEDILCKLCETNKPSRKFGFWTYVYYVLHNTKRQDNWIEVKRTSGRLQYKEVVDDFRVFAQGFGSKEYLFNYIVDIYNEYNSLNKYTIRIKRTGSGMSDTSYIVASTTKVVELTDEIKQKAKELPAIKDFFKQKWGQNKDSKVIEKNQEKGPFPVLDNKSSRLNNEDEDNTDDLF